jgi:glycosyltransferase involved in cell wall biosynthesis
MKIGMLVSEMTVSGGYQKLVLRLTAELAKQGHEVVVYTRVVNYEKCYPETIRTADIKSLRKGDDTPVSLKERLAEYKVLSGIVGPNLDALILHDYASFYFLNSYPYDARIIWMVNNQPPVELGNWRLHLRQAISKNPVKSLRRIPKLTEDLVDDYRLHKAFRRLDCCAAYDSFNKKLCEKVTGRKSVVVFAGADLEGFEKILPGQDYKKKNSYHVLSVGVLFPYRRYEDLIQALAILKRSGMNVSVTIVGSSTYSPDHLKKLKALAKRLDIREQVVFKEQVSSKELLSLYKSSDAFVFINDGNTWGISVFEAVAAGLPTVITSNIGAADLIENGRTGWVVPPKDPTQAAEALKTILTKRDLAKRVALTANREVTPIVTWEAYTNRMLDLIK